MFRQHSSQQRQQFEPLDSDFVLIAEFSEQEGPKPLITIPEDGGANFDKNMFSVRIMAVDYQSQTRGGAFQFAIDTQVVQTEEDDQVQAHAYVHHFTLYDVKARGYVRPFCMSYVTGDQSKLMLNFDDMIRQFGRASEAFRFSNMRVFHRDLLMTRTELRKMKATIQEKLKEELAGKADGDKTNLEGDENPNADSQKPSWDDGFDYEGNKSSENKLALEQIEASLKEVQLIIDHVSSELETAPVRKVLNDLDRKSRAKESSTPEKKAAELVQSYPPSPVAFLAVRRFEKPLRTLGELCEIGEEEGLCQLKQIHRNFSRTKATLLIEKQDTQLISPRSTLLTIGRSLVLNFKSTEGRCNHCTTARRTAERHTYNPCSHRPSLQQDVAISTQSLYSIDSFVSLSEDEYSLDRDFFNRTDSPRSLYLDIGETITNERFIDGVQSDASSGDVEWKEPKSDELSALELALPDEEDTDQEREEDDEKTGREEMPLAQSPGTGPGRRNLPFHCYADHVENPKEKRPGTGILHFLKDRDFGLHLIAAVLRGRTVIVTGSEEEAVERVVRMLWLFVPGHSSQQTVIVWQTASLSLVDLARVKIVGISKKANYNNPVPSFIRPYVTTYDVDNRKVVTPEYKGKFVTSIVSSSKLWKTETAYVAHIHSVFLEISQKAFLFYHTFLLKPSVEASTPISLTSGSSGSYFNDSFAQTTPDRFLDQLNVTEDDKDIVQYFAKTISLQQLGDVFDNAPTVYLDHRKCTEYPRGKHHGRWNR